jgi:hypothetical protein
LFEDWQWNPGNEFKTGKPVRILQSGAGKIAILTTRFKDCPEAERKIVGFLKIKDMEIVESLQALSPDTKLNEWFFAIIKEGTGKEFKKEDNERWLEVTRPILEAFFHARYFLEMAVKYVRELKHPPDRLPSGWASLLHLYNLR